MKQIKRGEIYYADLSPIVGSEQGGLRPVLVCWNRSGQLTNPVSDNMSAGRIRIQWEKSIMPSSPASG